MTREPDPGVEGAQGAEHAAAAEIRDRTPGDGQGIDGIAADVADHDDVDDAGVDDEGSGDRPGRRWPLGIELAVFAIAPVIELPVPVAVPLLVLAALSLWFRGKGFGQVGLIATPRAWPHFGIGVVLGVAGFVVTWAVVGPMGRLAGLVIDLAYLPPVRGNGEVLFQALILAWTTAVAAEMVFRGYVLDRLLGDVRLSPTAAVVVAALLYGWVLAASGAGQDPGSVVRFAGAAVVGAGYGALYLAAGRNLILPIAVHGAFESTHLLFLFLRLL